MITLKVATLVFFALAAVATSVCIWFGERLQNLSDDIDDMGEQ